MQRQHNPTLLRTSKHPHHLIDIATTQQSSVGAKLKVLSCLCRPAMLSCVSMLRIVSNDAQPTHCLNVAAHKQHGPPTFGGEMLGRSWDCACVEDRSLQSCAAQHHTKPNIFPDISVSMATRVVRDKGSSGVLRCRLEAASLVDCVLWHCSPTA